MPATDDVPRILIVDDSRMVRATIARHLKGKFTHVEAVDGEDGWPKLSADPSIRAVISDLGMPKLDGFGLISRIRKSDDSRIRAEGQEFQRHCWSNPAISVSVNR